jgi:hypothetical protein
LFIAVIILFFLLQVIWVIFIEFLFILALSLLVIFLLFLYIILRGFKTVRRRG